MLQLLTFMLRVPKMAIRGQVVTDLMRLDREKAGSEMMSRAKVALRAM
jgi:hypothetical protein